MYRFLTSIVIISLLFVSTNTHGQELVTDSKGSERFEVGEELFFTGRLDRFVLGETFAIKNETDVYIELESFVRVLDFPIRSDNTGRKFNGWFSKEDNIFSLTVDEANNVSVSVRGEPQVVDENDVSLEFDLVYVDTAALTKWFGIDFDIDYIKLEMRYLPREPLPIQRKLIRQSRNMYATNNNEAQFPELARGYEILSPQLIDVFAATNYTENSKKLRGIYSAIGAREVAQHHLQFSINGSDSDLLRDGALRISKTSKNKGLLGFLDVSRYEFGDITPVQAGSLSTSNRSVGLRFQNTDSSQRLNRLTTSINGDVQLGWDIELYRGGVLLRQIFDIEDNRYEFNDVDLFYGENEFEVVLYGPQGQVIRETKTEIIDDASIGSDTWAYQMSIVRLNDSLFNDQDDELDNSLVANLSLGKNISNNISLNLGLQRALDSDDYDNASLGISTRILDSILVGVQLSSDLDNFVRLGTSLRTKVSNQSITLTTNYNRNIQDSSTEPNESVSSSLSLTGNLEGIGLQSISYSNQIGIANNGSTTRSFLENSINLNTSLGKLFHTLSYRREPKMNLVNDEFNVDFDNDTLIGGFGYQGGMGPVFTRVNAGYNATDSFELNSLAASFSYNPTPNLRTRLLISRDLISELTSYDFNLSYRHEQMSLGAQIRYSDISGYNLGINTRFSFGGLPFDYDIFTTRQTLISNGTIAVRVFEDLNGNNEFDIGEPLIPNIEVNAKNSRAKVETGADGIALIHNLSLASPIDIFLENKNENEPFLIPVVDGVSIQPRMGFIDKLDYPVVQGSEIEGTIYFAGENSRPAAFAKLLLVKNNKVVRTIEPEFDGYFLLTAVPPGRYYIKIDADYAKLNELRDKVLQTVEIKNESEVYVLDDIYIEKQPFQDGFIVNLGVYANSGLARAQTLLFKNRMRSLRIPETLEVVKLSQGNNEKFVVSAAIVRDLELADKYCQFMAQQGVDCSVLDYRIKLAY